MVSPVEVIWIVPLSATAQLLLPGTEVMAVPVQLIMPLLPSVAVAEPLPDIAMLPMQVAANVPETDVAVMLVIVHVNPPHVPGWPIMDFVEENDVPVFRLVLSSDVVTAAVVEGVVATLPHAVVTNSAAKDTTDKSLERMGGILACL